MKNRFFWKKPDEPFYYIGSDTMAGKCRNIPSQPDLSGMIQLYTYEYFIKSLMDFMVGCRDMRESENDQSKPSCFWFGSKVFQYSGYSTMNKNIVSGLADMGANVQMFTNITEIDMDVGKALDLARKGFRTIPSNSPCVHNTTFSRGKNTYLVHYTMSEYDDAPNEYHKKLLNWSNEIWVPSEWDRRKFENGGISQPIMVIPLGVDSNTFSPRTGKVVFSSGLNEFVFISVCAHNWRKGHDVTLRAYNKAFGAGDNVSLLFVTHGYDLIEDVEVGVRARLGEFMKEDSPHVAFCFSKIPEEVMAYVYGTCNAFVLFSRGEGWGLPYIEASACGLPVLGTYHGGQSSFLREDDSFLVRPDIKSKAPPKDQEFVGMYKDVYFADFSDKAVDEAAEKMRYVYENHEKCKAVANMARERIVRDFSWKKSCELVYNRLVELQP